MKSSLIRPIIIALVIVEALVAMMMSREVLVLPTSGLVLAAGLLFRDSEDWGFYTFTASLPLVVAVGAWYLPSGGIILATTTGLIFIGPSLYWGRKERAGAVLLLLLIVAAAVATPFIGGITGLAGLFLCIAAAGSALALFRNRLLKRHYLGDT